jgi:alpha-mannosidase
MKGATVQRAREFNNPIYIFQNIQVNNIPTLVESSKPNVMIDSIKKAEESDAIIIRMHETQGSSTDTTLHFGADAASAMECNLMETDEKSYKIAKSKLILKFKPFEIKTIKLNMKVSKRKR